MTHFETSYGNQIQCWNGYRTNNDYRGYIEAHVESNTQEKSKKLDFLGFYRDVFVYSMMIDLLERHGYKIEGEKALDIGGGVGTASRLLQMEGKVNQADVLDIEDWSEGLTEQRFMKLYQKYQSLVELAKWDKDFSAKFRYRQQNVFGYYPSVESKLYNIEYNNNPNRGDFIVADFVETKLNKKYDFISGLLCLEYFNIEEVFEKVSEVLKPGGIFFFLVNNWWWPVNSTGIVGGFPYACQRLTREDLRRYFEKEHPERVDKVIESYDYYHKGNQPTVKNYVNTGYAHNLIPIGSERFVTKTEEHYKAKTAPLAIERERPGYLQDVLNDIHEFRDDVDAIDLMSPYVAVAFNKKK